MRLLLTIFRIKLKFVSIFRLVEREIALQEASETNDGFDQGSSDYVEVSESLLDNIRKCLTGTKEENISALNYLLGELQNENEDDYDDNNYMDTDDNSHESFKFEVSDFLIEEMTQNEIEEIEMICDSEMESSVDEKKIDIMHQSVIEPPPVLNEFEDSVDNNKIDFIDIKPKPTQQKEPIDFEKRFEMEEEDEFEKCFQELAEQEVLNKEKEKEYHRIKAKQSRARGRLKKAPHLVGATIKVPNCLTLQRVDQSGRHFTSEDKLFMGDLYSNDFDIRKFVKKDEIIWYDD